MGLTLQELIKLDKDTYEALGWNRGSAIDMSCDVVERGDIWLFYDIHPKTMENHLSLKPLFDDLFDKLENIWGKTAKMITFNDTDDDDNLSGYCVSIELAETVEE